MGVIVHGTAGASIYEAEAKFGRSDTRRAEYFEGATGRALETWLSSRPGTFHLFHDLTRLDTAGHGYGRLNLGAANIDHVILSGAGWIMVDAKGTGKAILTVDGRGKGISIRMDGTSKPQPWMDSHKWYSHMGALVRLTGLHGWHLFACPDRTTFAPEIRHARCMNRPGSLIINLGDLANGKLESWFTSQGMGALLTGDPVSADIVSVLSATSRTVRLPSSEEWPQSGLAEHTRNLVSFIRATRPGKSLTGEVIPRRAMLETLDGRDRGVPSR